MNFSDITPDDLAKVKDLAAAFTPIDEIAALMECDEDELRECIHEKMHPLRMAYMCGKADSALAIRKAEINLAANGSPMAIQHATLYLSAMSNQEIE